MSDLLTKKRTDPVFDAAARRTVLDQLLASNNAETPAAIIEHAGAGLGKTTQYIKAIAARLISHEIRLVLHAAPTHRLCEEAKKKYKAAGVSADILRGKTHPDACVRHEEARQLQSIGLSTKSMCEGCPFAERCEYIAQRTKLGYGGNQSANSARTGEVGHMKPHVLLVPSEYLRSGGIPKEIDPDLIVVDETMHDYLRVAGQVKLKNLNGYWGAQARDDSNEIAQTANQVLTAIGYDDPYQQLLAPYEDDPEGPVELAKSIRRVAGVVEKNIREKAGVDDQVVEGEGTALNDDTVDAIASTSTMELEFWRATAAWAEMRAEDNDAIGTYRLDTRGSRIDFGYRCQFPYSAPLLVLDASANEAIYRSMLGETHEVTVNHYADLPEDIERTFIHGMGWSKTSLIYSHQNPAEGRKRKAAQANRVAHLEAILADISRREGPDRSILLVTAKSVEDEIRGGRIGKAFVEFHGENLALEHFNNLRGSNAYEDFDTVVVVGKNEMPEGALAVTTGLTFPHLIAGFQRQAPVFDKQHEGVAVMKSGEQIAYKKPAYKNEAGILQAQIREEEIVQAERRLRACHRLGQGTRSYIVGNCLPDGLVCDEVIDAKEFRPKKVKDTGPLEQVADAFYGCVSVKAWQLTHNVTRNAAKLQLKSYGFSEAPRDGWAAVTAKVSGKRGAPTTIYVPDDYTATQAEEAAAHHLARIKDASPDAIEISGLAQFKDAEIVTDDDVASNGDDIMKKFDDEARREAVNRILEYQDAKTKGDQREINVAADKLFDQFGPLVGSVSSKYARAMDAADVKQFAQVALLKAADYFDPDKGDAANVGSFVWKSVRREVANIVASGASCIEVPDYLRRLMPEMRSEIKSGATADAVFKKFAKRLQHSVENIESAYSICYADVSDVDDVCLDDDLCDDQPTADESLESKRRTAAVTGAIGELSYLERVVLRSRAGIGLELSDKDIAATLSGFGFANENGADLSSDRVRQVDAAARRKLARRLQSNPAAA